MTIFTMKDFLKLLSISLLLGLSIGALGNTFQETVNAGGIDNAVEPFVISQAQ